MTSLNGIGYNLTDNVAAHIEAENSFGEIETPDSVFFNLELLPGYAYADYYAEGAFGNETSDFIYAENWNELDSLIALDKSGIAYDTVESVYSSRHAAGDKFFAIICAESDVDAVREILASVNN